ncbi:MAG: TraB/GumN family protein [Candidatus Woesearchaeota archaeon]
MARRQLKKSKLIILLLVLSGVAAIPLVGTQIEEGPQGILYEVEGGQNTLYLFGTLHMGVEEMYPLAPEVSYAFKESDVLALEINLEEISTREDLTEIGIYSPEDGKLSDVVTEKTFETLHDILWPYGIDNTTLDTFKPWYAESLISRMLLENMEMRAGSGIEERLTDMAKDQHKNIIGLEGTEGQTRAYGMLSNTTQVRSLSKAIESFYNGTLENETRDLISAWIEGDVDHFTEERRRMIEENETPSENEFTVALLDERDRKMADKIEEFLEDDSENTYFVAVGTLHLTGENSIVEHLADKDYDIRRVDDHSFFTRIKEISSSFSS